MDAVISALQSAHHLDISRFDPSFIEMEVTSRCKVTTGGDIDSYLLRLTDDRSEAETLARSLHVVYSTFFRDPLTFALLERRILPALLETKEATQSDIRIWSAGCAAGQEPWSLAILLDDLTSAQDRPTPFTIFATDISEVDLSKAKAGIYPAEALGNVRLKHLDSCFTPTSGLQAIADRLKRSVHFSCHDLLDSNTTSPPASIYGDLDLVFCSNVLFYYREEMQRLILDKARRSLVPGGLLITADSEREIVLRENDFVTACDAPVFSIGSGGALCS